MATLSSVSKVLQVPNEGGFEDEAPGASWQWHGDVVVSLVSCDARGAGPVAIPSSQPGDPHGLRQARTRPEMCGLTDWLALSFYESQPKAWAE